MKHTSSCTSNSPTPYIFTTLIKLEVKNPWREKEHYRISLKRALDALLSILQTIDANENVSKK
jgi:hypothetical protein